MAESGVELHGDRVTEHLADEPIAEMPEIAGPDLLELIPLHQLGEGGFDPPPALAEHRAALRIRIGRLVAEGRREHEVIAGKLRGHDRRPVIPIGQERALARSTISGKTARSEQSAPASEIAAIRPERSPRTWRRKP